MKILTAVLAASFVSNLVLFGIIVVGSAEAPDDRLPKQPTLPAAAKAGAGDDSAEPGAETWAGLQSEDLSTQRDRLRAAGFPPELVRAILAAQVRENFAARRKAIEEAQGEIPFWKNPSRDPKAQAALRDLNKEQEKIMKDLLGRDARDDDPTYAAYLQRQFGDLPADKVDRLRDIQEDYNRQRSDIYANARAGLLPDEQQKVAALDKAMRADFAAVLTPEEFAAYNLRSGATAEQLRYSLAAFDATESEYQAIFQLQSAFDEKYGRMFGPLSAEEAKARSDAQKQLTDDIKTALGETRAADYQRGTDYNFRQVNQLVARLELPPETAVGLWNTQKEIEKRRGEIYGPGTSTEWRTAQLTALQQEATTKIATLLGGDASRVEIYKQNGGQWLQSLAPRPPIPPPSR